MRLSAAKLSTAGRPQGPSSGGTIPRITLRRPAACDPARLPCEGRECVQVASSWPARTGCNNSQPRRTLPMPSHRDIHVYPLLYPYLYPYLGIHLPAPWGPPRPVRRTIPWPGQQLTRTNSMCRLRLGERVDSATGPASQQVMRMLRTVPFRSTVVRSVQLIQTRQRTGPGRSDDRKNAFAIFRSFFGAGFFRRAVVPSR